MSRLTGQVSGGPAGAGGRLFASGLPTRSLAALRRAATACTPPVGVVDATGWTPEAWEAAGTQAGDAFLAWFPGEPSPEAPPAPLLPRPARIAWVPAGRKDLDLASLRAGYHECLHRPGDLPAVLARALLRAGLPEPGAPARDGDEDPPAVETYDGLFPNLYDWIYVVGIAEDGGMTFETVNPPLNAGSGFLNPDFAGRAPEACLPGTTADLLRAHFRKALQEGRPLQFEEEHTVSGRTRNFHTILTPVRNKWGRIHRLAGISRDITALREAQAALQTSEARLNLALEGTQQSLWDWNLATGRMYRSPRWFEMLGLEPGCIPETLQAGLDLIHPEDRHQTEAAMLAHIEGRLPRFQAEYRLRTRGGEWLWIFDAGKVVSLDSAGQPLRVAGMCTDITERRRAEESLRALVGGVVHEIRNPVYGISINLDALEATFGAEARFAPFVAALRESSDRIASLMNDLRDYGEPRTLNPEPCQVASLLEEAIRSCEALAQDQGCRVRLALQDPRLVLPLNGRRIHQVFRNLLENALHHAPPGSEVRLAGARTRAEGHDWWTFTVEDEGPGFAAETLARAFEPFFTRRKGGTGLGLSIVKRVVEEHGGSVEATNRPGGGACLKVRLPAPRIPMELMGAPRA